MPELEVRYRVKCDIEHETIVPKIPVVQNDSGTRIIDLSLLKNGEAYSPPSDVKISVAFRKPDGKKGWYDKLPDGSPACSITGSTVSVILAPQVMTYPGSVDVCVVLNRANNTQLSVFPIIVDVDDFPAEGKGISNDYFNVQNWADVNEAFDNIDFILNSVTARLTELENVTTDADQASVIVALSDVQTGYYNVYDNTFYSEIGRATATFVPKPNRIYRITTSISSKIIAAAMYLDETGKLIGTEYVGTGSFQMLKNAILTIPRKAKKVRVQNANIDQVDLSVSSTGLNRTLKSYTKHETDEKIDPLNDRIDTLETVTTDIEYDVTEIKVENLKNAYYTLDNQLIETDPNRSTGTITPIPNTEYLLTTCISSKAIAGAMYIDAYGKVISNEYVGVGGNYVYLTDVPLHVPKGTVLIRVQSSSRFEAIPSVKAGVSKRVLKSYTKAETNALLGKGIHYGIRWKTGNGNDTGERCFSAIGLKAEPAVGSLKGHSDFDSIYPWSDIKRCNVKTNANGAKIVTYEGEPGFTLDGSNGDVFVRIPKFYVSKYKSDGYTYRTVSESGTNVHPVFVEDGVELDEIFVSAFEASIDAQGKLRSVAGVIPSANTTPVNFLAASKKNGAGYSLYDSRCIDAIWMLIAIEYGTRNINSILSYGASDYMQPIQADYLNSVKSMNSTNEFHVKKMDPAYKPYLPVGSNITICRKLQTTILTQAKLLSVSDIGHETVFRFDGKSIDVDLDCFIGSAPFDTNAVETLKNGITWHTGRCGFADKNSKMRNPIRYRWIENLWGNLWTIIPDAIFSNLQMYVCPNMRNYSFDQSLSGYLPIGNVMPAQGDNGNKADVTGMNYWIVDLIDDTFAKGTSFGKNYDKSLTSKKSFGGYYYLSSGFALIANGGGFDHAYRSNMMTNRAWLRTDSQWYLYGARLQYKHIR